ncbi:protein-L-isoaspartate O-methyltransferase [Labrys sp. LIt4]|uniref:protein-L-isoaspartate O-methyltransferase family protein n=1 Tax=Labrys sp. LIt4 TaxID=2821355 RepID=UPI001AE03F06|nr:protein-L-isoaspartate O-methyltransferase [Labrys sp. LIt4]MBP0581004.1 protein-L-isoaspartate O-methyltransferase [Labrys sp. LIt4]
MASEKAALEQARRDFARSMLKESGSADPRIERAFELVPREAFLPPGPWLTTYHGGYVETPDADPIHLYRNRLVALKADKQINTGEPALHAAWLGAVAPRAGERVSHIGAGLGYYTAILSVLTLPGGRVTAFEIEEDLAEQARRNLKPFDGVSVIHDDATRVALPPSDLIYVNAGVVAPPLAWLAALLPGGRLIFPWRPREEIGIALRVDASPAGFAVRALMPSWFIPCTGASREIPTIRPPRSSRQASAVRSLWPVTARVPDESAIAVYPDLWFSSAALDA